MNQLTNQPINRLTSLNAGLSIKLSRNVKHCGNARYCRYAGSFQYLK